MVLRKIGGVESLSDDTSATPMRKMEATHSHAKETQSKGTNVGGCVVIAARLREALDENSLRIAKLRHGDRHPLISTTALSRCICDRRRSSVNKNITAQVRDQGTETRYRTQSKNFNIVL